MPESTQRCLVPWPTSKLNLSRRCTSYVLGHFILLSHAASHFSMLLLLSDDTGQKIRPVELADRCTTGTTHHTPRTTDDGPHTTQLIGTRHHTPRARHHATNHRGGMTGRRKKD